MDNAGEAGRNKPDTQLGSGLPSLPIESSAKTRFRLEEETDTDNVSKGAVIEVVFRLITIVEEELILSSCEDVSTIKNVVFKTYFQSGKARVFDGVTVDG